MNTNLSNALDSVTNELETFAEKMRDARRYAEEAALDADAAAKECHSMENTLDDLLDTLRLAVDSGKGAGG